MGLVLGPHARTNRTRHTRVAEPRLPAPEEGRPGEGQSLTPDAPHNVAGVPPRGRPPTTSAVRSPHRACKPRGHCLAPTPAHPRPQHVGGGPRQPAQKVGSQGRGAPGLSRPSQRQKAPSPGTPFRHFYSEQRRPARAHAVGLVPGLHARTNRTQDKRVAEPRLPAQEDGRPGEGQRLTPDAPYNGGRPPLPGQAPHHPRGMQPPQGMQAEGTVLGPHTRTPAPTARGWRTPTARPVGVHLGQGERLTSDNPHNGDRHPPPREAISPQPQRATQARKSTRCGTGASSPGPHRPHPGHTGGGTPTARPRGRADGGGGAPDLRRPSQRQKAPPAGTPFRHPHSEQRRFARAHVVGPVLGPHARTDRTRDTRVAESQLPAQEDWPPGEGQLLTPDAPHNGGCPPQRAGDWGRDSA